MRKESKNHVYMKDHYYAVMSILWKKHNSEIKATCRGNENKQTTESGSIYYSFQRGDDIPTFLTWVFMIIVKGQNYI